MKYHLILINKFYDFINKNLKKLSKDHYLIYISILISTTGFIHGFIISYFDLIHKAETSYKANNNIESILYMFYSGEVIGSLLSYIFSDSFGRKTTIIYASILCIITLFIHMLYHGNKETITARLLLGCLSGTLLPISLTYLSEVSTAVERGKVVCILPLLSVLGFVTCKSSSLLFK